MQTSRCPLCGEGKSKKVITASDRMLRQQTLWCYRQCRTCEHLFLSPHPNLKDIGKYYPQEYYAFNTPKERKTVIDTRKNDVKSRLRMIVLKEFRGYDHLEPCFVYGPTIKQLARVLKFRWKWIPTFEGKGVLLDIGCGSGSYISWLQGLQLGWQGYGVEIDRKAVEKARARGLEVFCGPLKLANFQSAFFDLIRLNHVFEHIPEPIPELREMHRILKPNGKLMMELPNIKSINYRLFKKFWFHLDPPRHMNHYRPTVISSILKNEGFRVIGIRTNASPHGLLGSIHYFLAEKGLMDSDYVRARKFRNHKILGLVFLPFTMITNSLGYGDIMSVLAEKT